MKALHSIVRLGRRVSGHRAALAVAGLFVLSAGVVLPGAPATSAVVAAAAGAAPVAEMPVPAALQVPLLLKILTYDRNFGSHGESALHVAIIVAPGDPVSTRTSSEIAEVFRSLADKTVRKLPITFQTLEYTSDDQIANALPAKQVNVLYIAPGNDKNLRNLIQMSHTRGAISTTGVPTYVEKGVAVGIGVRQDKPQILINLASSRAAGSDFDAGLLRIASIVR
jgi:hypothetical protein